MRRFPKLSDYLRANIVEEWSDRGERKIFCFLISRWRILIRPDIDGASDLEDALMAELTQFAAFMRTQTSDCEWSSEAYHVQASFIIESFSDISEHRDCVVHLSLHDGIKHIWRTEFLNFGNNQRRAAVLNGSGKARRLVLMNIAHKLMHSLDFTDTIE